MIGAGEMKEKNISLEKNDFVIAVDGGYKYCLNLNINQGDRNFAQST